MVSVMIEAGEDPHALAASLSTLVAGAVEGMVREVVVIDRGLDAATREIADHAGCRIVPGSDLAGTVSASRGDWVLLLEAGARLSLDWVEAVATHIGDVEKRGLTPRAARFSRAKRDRPGLLARLTGRRTALVEGLLVPKPQAIGLAKRAATLEAMGRGVATTRLVASLRPRLAPSRR
ncbi:glycosyl transferase family 2 [Aureimonas sp. SA4125]|uniref:glycosyl transferase family 2 n=1 Tax=Aureimonas sp. SA4125 TaxID=2826993 RepID=UPI001CC707E3|nr:glycosyl transferase family 2 [Aureimonas sp. SA4125]BDA83052.1 glycosyl transferase family 2 [Aureimonas sp. SA4125]